MKKTIAWPVIFFIGLLLIAGFFFAPYYRFITEEMKISPFKAVLSNDALKTFDNQVNILILGIAGQDHDGPNLSDSIIVANYNLKSNKLTTISIPRDIWSPTLRDKINSAYAYGEAKKQIREDLYWPSPKYPQSLAYLSITQPPLTSKNSKSLSIFWEASKWTFKGRLRTTNFPSREKRLMSAAGTRNINAGMKRLLSGKGKPLWTGKRP